MSNGSTTWTFSYDANGMRTSRSNGTTTYQYVYNGSSLVQMTVGSNTLYFTSDTVTLNGITYYYVKNLQGDVVAILNSSGTAVVQYTYDAWGKPLSITGSMATTLGRLNPIRYRSYVYDQESGLYYLQSRYYDPEVGRFLNADAYASTGQGILGNNMFAYCCNRVVVYADFSGTEGYRVVGVGIQFEVTVDNVCIGVEVIMYLDPTVCDGSGAQIVMYTYSGVSIDFLDPSQYARLLTELAAIASEIDIAEDNSNMQAISHSAITALKGFILQESSFSYSAVLIVGNDEFVDASSYSGSFDSVSATANNWKVTYSQSSSCFALAIGRSTGGIGLSYSYSMYSDPVYLLK